MLFIVHVSSHLFTLGLENQLDKIKIKILITAACPSFWSIF
jgi:hypothetical protein